MYTGGWPETSPLPGNAYGSSRVSSLPAKLKIDDFQIIRSEAGWDPP